MTKQLKISCVTPLGLFLIASPALVAQVTTGQISGRVTDSDKKPLRAKVVLSAPQLMGQREVPTDANGEWRAVLLPPGDYSIRISADGHVGSTVRNIRIGIGSALRQDSVLKPVTTASATVEIVGTENIIADKTDTKTAVSYSADRLAQLTGGRDYGSAVSLTPGAISTGSGTYSIRGGASGSTIMRLDGADIKDSLEGRVNATWYLQDSIEEVSVVLSPLNARYGRTVGGSLDVVTKSGGNEFSGTFRVSAGRPSWRAENRAFRYERDLVSDSASSRSRDFTLGGPIIKDRLWFSLSAQVTPSSSDTYYTMDVTQANNRTYLRAVRAYDGPNWTNSPTNTIYNAQHTGINNLTLINPVTLLPADTAAPQLINGGYYFPYPLNIAGQPVTHGYPTWPLDQPVVGKDTQSFYSAKLTYGINENHKVTIGGQLQSQDYKNYYATYRIEQALDMKFDNQSFNFVYQGILGERTFAEFKFNRQFQRNLYMIGREDGAAGPVIQVYMDRFDTPEQSVSTMGPNTGEFMGKVSGPVRLTTDERNNSFGSANLTMYRDFWGMNHNIDAGVEFYQADIYGNDSAGPDNASIIVGGLYQNREGEFLFPALKWMAANTWGQSAAGRSGPAPSRRQYYRSSSNYKNTNIALYFNDQATINDHWNVMFGFRYDKIDSTNNDGTELFAASGLSPRLSVTYDLKGDSSHVLKFNYSRMQADYPTSFIMNFVPTYLNSTPYVDYVWTGAALPGGAQPDPIRMGGGADYADPNNPGVNMYGLRFVTLEDLRNMDNWGNPIGYYASNATNRKDKNLKPGANDEFAIEYRRNFKSGSYTRMAYIYRVMSNAWAAKREYNPDYWVLIDPAVQFNAQNLRPMYAQATDFVSVSDLWRDYHGLEIETFTRINSIFSLTLNYAYSRLRGNAESNDGGAGFADSNAAQGYYGNTEFFEANNIPIELRSPSGALGSDSPHRVLALLSAVVPLGNKGAWISYSLRMGYSSGSNWSATYTSNTGPYFRNLQSYYNATPTYSQYNVPATYPSTWTRYYSARGAYHLNDQHWADATIAWEVPIWKRVKTMGNINISNLFNMIYPINYNRETAPYDSGEPDHLWVRGDRFGGVRDSAGNIMNVNSGRSASLSIGLKF